MNNFRKPGAQPGNRNAYKHGFYAKAISTLEGNSLKIDTSLGDELKAAHIIAERIFNRLNGHGLGADDSGPIDEATIRAINTLANLYGSISTLARSHQLVEGKYKPVETAILEALRSINFEDGYDNV